MDCLTLLAEAREAGLTVLAEGEQLTIRGPRSAEHLARQIVEHKADVLACLAAEQVPRLPGRWRERTVHRRGGPVVVLERIDPPQQFPWVSDVDFEDLPEPWRL